LVRNPAQTTALPSVQKYAKVRVGGQDIIHAMLGARLCRFFKHLFLLSATGDCIGFQRLLAAILSRNHFFTSV